MDTVLSLIQVVYSVRIHKVKIYGIIYNSRPDTRQKVNVFAPF